ncbi:MAG: hypothetical protein M0Z85_05590 [Gammaproteobacteria bacterium]|nr:hypothetical protein [Gammaproteobacteria bacterium]
MEFTSPLLARAQAAPPHWAHTAIEAFPEDRFRRGLPFVDVHEWQACGDINVFTVAGTRHPDYLGLTWLEFLARGKRMPMNHCLWEENPGYYRDDARKLPEMSYISLDGFSWYVDSDGNHRTAIARFDFAADTRTQLRGVTLSHYRLDEAFRALFAQASDIVVQRHLGLLRHDNRLIKRDDAAGWKRDQHANTATLETARTSLRAAWPSTLDAGGLRRLIAALERPAWRRWFARV